MLENRTVYLEGTFVAGSKATLPIMSHSLGRGSAIFDVLGFGETTEGRAIFRLDEHVARFLRSASALEMTLPLSAEELQEAIKETVRRNTLKAGAIKIIGFYPEPSLSLLPPQKPLHLAIFVFDPADDFGEKPLADSESATALVSRWRRLDPRTVPIEAKAAANYLNGLVARTEAKNLGFDYAIMLDLAGNIAEGGTESIFLVREGRLLTPNIGHILQGITRKSILAAAEAMGIETFAGALKEDLLGEADEIFFSGTIHRVLPRKPGGEPHPPASARPAHEDDCRKDEGDSIRPRSAFSGLAFPRLTLLFCLGKGGIFTPLPSLLSMKIGYAACLSATRPCRVFQQNVELTMLLPQKCIESCLQQERMPQNGCKI